VSSAAGADFQLPALHHGAAFADFDNDGRIDVALTTLEGPVKLFRNVTPGGHWIAIRLRGVASNRDGLGASITVTLPDGKSICGHATTSVGYASSSEPLVRFGLGPHAEASRIHVRWPSGRTQDLVNVAADRVVPIEETGGAAR
jgi:hypothetical protein